MFNWIDKEKDKEKQKLMYAVYENPENSAELWEIADFNPTIVLF